MRSGLYLMGLCLMAVLSVPSYAHGHSGRRDIRIHIGVADGYSHCGPSVHYAPRSTVIYQQSEPIVVYRDAPDQGAFYKLGHDWAEDLRNDIVGWEHFVFYVKDNVLRASTQGYNDFRNGFIASYGVNGARAFEKAIEQARQG